MPERRSRDPRCHVASERDGDFNEGGAAPFALHHATSGGHPQRVGGVAACVALHPAQSHCAANDEQHATTERTALRK